MKTTFTIYRAFKISWLLLLVHWGLPVQAQLTATVATPMGMGSDCGGGNNSYRVFNYNTATPALTNLNVCTPPSLYDPTTGAIFAPLGGSTSFDPVNQMIYYIETTSGNNSIIWSWVPGTCPTGNLAPVYTFTDDFIVGLDFNTVTGQGYQIEFSTSGKPYTVYLREVSSFSPPTFGASVPITFPAGTTINSQNGDYVITPTGVMYLAVDNQLFTLNYSTYSSGVLNATSIGKATFPVPGDYIVGLAYADGNLIASVGNNKTSCFYELINMSSGSPVFSIVTSPPGTNTSTTFYSTDMATLITGVGAAKNVSSVITLGASEWQVQYNVKVRNYGNVDLTNVQVSDNLAAIFGPTLVSASVAAVGSLPSGMSVNTGYNGTTDTLLFAPGGSMIASPPDSAVVRITMILNNPDLNTVYNNSAIATATGTLFGENVRDSSDNNAALNPDPDGNDVPDQAGEGVPTPLILSNWIILANTVIDFNGQAGVGVNNLHWTLQNAQAGSTILVQRSTDGQNFVTQSQIPVPAITSGAYSWQDDHPMEGVNYYRLQLVTTAGAGVYSDIVTLRPVDPNAQLTVTPNPFSGSVQFGLSLPSGGPVSYRVLDLASHVIQAGQVTGQAGPNTYTVGGLANIPAGIYVLEVMAGRNRYIRKLEKLH